MDPLTCPHCATPLDPTTLIFVQDAAISFNVHLNDDGTITTIADLESIGYYDDYTWQCLNCTNEIEGDTRDELDRRNTYPF